MRKIQKVILAAGLVLAVGVGDHFRSDWALSGLGGYGTGGGYRRTPGAGRTPQQRKLWLQKQQRLSRLWQERRKKDVVPDVMPFLGESDPSLRERAVRILGRLEDKRALPLLKAMEQQVGNAKSEAQYQAMKAAPLLTLRLATSRIESRSLRGQAKLNAVAQGVGIKWRDVVVLSQRINGEGGNLRNPQGRVWREVLDVLYQMGKQGEDITPWKAQLSLAPPEKILLQAATLNRDQEIELYMDYLSQLRVVKDNEITLRLASLVEGNSSRIVEKLREMSKHRIKYPHRNGYVELIFAAVYSRDSKALEAIKLFENDENKALRHYALSAKEAATNNSLFLPMP